LKWTSKIEFIVARCHKVAGANKFLVDWVSKLNPHVVLIPSTIDPSYHAPSAKPRGPDQRVVVGWTGTHSTAGYLELLRFVIKGLQEELDFEFRVICDVDPGFPELRCYRFVEWREASEIEDLSAFDVGVMPVPDGEWEKGKVGFKAVQYSAMAIPSVVSSTGSGREVVLDGETGRVVDNNEAAWREALKELLSEEAKRRAFGLAAREHILKHYSVPAWKQAYIELFE
jgi:glycosyltransferase involved in cell wall biosynthesis